MGYVGGRSALGEIVRDVRPPRQRGFEVRFETAAGEQAQVDFAHLSTEFEDAPQQRRSIWLFTIVLGHSRYLWGRFVEHQDLQTVLRCHMPWTLSGWLDELYPERKERFVGQATSVRYSHHVKQAPSLIWPPGKVA